MKFIHCALPAEARSVIDFYGLKQCIEKPFRIYRNDEIVLVVSGIGQENVSTALGFAFGRYGVDNAIWLNIGVCGASSAELGRAFVVNKCINYSTGDAVYPPQLADHSFGTSQLFTVDAPEQRYMEEGLYDMEAFSFFRAATRFSSSEWVQSVKLVSDNAISGLAHVNKSFVVDTIEKHMAEVDAYLAQLNDLTSIAHAGDELQAYADEFLLKWRFSVTQKKQLTSVLKRFLVLSKSVPDMSMFNNLKSSREVLYVLSRDADQLSIRF